jgi:hypothetical protein
MNLTRELENALRGRRFSRINVRENTDVSVSR